MYWTDASRIVFNVLALVPSLIGLPLLVLAVIFGKDSVKRGPVYLNFIIAAALLGFSFGLLGLAGQQSELRPKTPLLCYIQTVLVDGTLAMTPVSILALVLQLGLGLYNMRNPAAASQWVAIRNMVFIMTPYATFMIFAVRDVLYINEIQAGGSEYEVVNPAYYCMLSAISSSPQRAFVENPLVLCIVVVSCVTLLVELFIAYFLWREWKSICASGKEGAQRVPVGAFIRLMLFTVCRIGIVAMSILVVKDPAMFPIAEFFHGTIPLVVFVIFGLQRDVLRTWLEWASVPLALFRCGSQPAAHSGSDACKRHRLIKPPQRPSSIDKWQLPSVQYAEHPEN